MRLITTTLMLVLAIATTACHKKAGDNQANADAAVANESASASAAPEATTSDNQAASTTNPTTKFDMSSVPVSNVKLGSFPYLSLPDGYEAAGASTLDIAKVPYWVGDHFEWIEGKVYQSNINVKTGKDFSGYEVKRNIEALVQQAGGKQVFEGKIPSDATDKLPQDVKQSLNTGLGGMYSDMVDIYLIHQADKDIWVQVSSNTAGGAWAITESKPFAPTAKLLPATALKDSIDKTGKATIHVNFAFDKADILPDATSQIAEVAKLMIDPALKLSVEGHTDNSGAPPHNRALSQARARSVVAALVSQGVASSRLSAKGFGSDHPVATNGTEDGRAQNRRVELVRV
jgi:outer membrane protein OmpA-like peptidoglycan-associated protein